MPSQEEVLGLSTQSILGQIRAARMNLNREEGFLREHFTAALRHHLMVGLFIDVTKPGVAHRAWVIRGRGYGNIFWIDGEVRVTINVAAPILSEWAVPATSVKVNGTGAHCPLGKQLTLQGYVFPAMWRNADELTEDEKVIKGLDWLRDNA